MVLCSSIKPGVNEDIIVQQEAAMISQIEKYVLRKLKRVLKAKISNHCNLNEKGQGLVEFTLVIAFIAGVVYVINYTDFYASMRGAFNNTVDIALTANFDDTKGQAQTTSKTYGDYFSAWHDKSSEWLINNTDSKERLKADQEALRNIASEFLGKDQAKVKEQIAKYSNAWGPDWLKTNINTNYKVVDENGWSEVMVPLSYKTNNIDDNGYVWFDAKLNLKTVSDLTDGKALTYENKKSFKSSSGDTYTASEQKSTTTDRLFYSDGMINQGDNKANDRAVVLQVHYNGTGSTATVDQVRISMRTGTGEQAINKDSNSQVLSNLDLTVGGTKKEDAKIISVNNPG